MDKPDSLRAHLTTAMPDLATDPDRFLVFIDDGSLVATGAEGLSFEYRYTLNLVLTDFALDPDAVMVPLLIWLREQQPELIDNPANRERIAFEADVLDNNRVDLSIKLPLTERVGVHARPGGGYDIEHYPEPQPEPYLQAEHWELYLKGQLLLAWDNPPR